MFYPPELFRTHSQMEYIHEKQHTHFLLNAPCARNDKIRNASKCRPRPVKREAQFQIYYLRPRFSRFEMHIAHKERTSAGSLEKRKHGKREPCSVSIEHQANDLLRCDGRGKLGIKLHCLSVYVLRINVYGPTSHIIINAARSPRYRISAKVCIFLLQQPHSYHLQLDTKQGRIESIPWSYSVNVQIIVKFLIFTVLNSKIKI